MQVPCYSVFQCYALRLQKRDMMLNLPASGTQAQGAVHSSAQGTKQILVPIVGPCLV